MSIDDCKNVHSMHTVATKYSKLPPRHVKLTIGFSFVQQSYFDFMDLLSLGEQIFLCKTLGTQEDFPASQKLEQALPLRRRFQHYCFIRETPPALQQSIEFTLSARPVYSRPCNSLRNSVVC